MFRPLEWIYPARANCLGCGSMLGNDEDWLCPACACRLDQLRPPSGTNLAQGCIISTCHAYLYGTPASNLVQALKYSGVRALVPSMARDMSTSLNALCRASDLIVPVPMHYLRKLRRGFNQAELLAKELSAKTGIPWENALVRHRNTPQQARLSHEQRQNNLDNAFHAHTDVRGKDILLVDDVFTTGVTTQKCAEALRDAGAGILCVATYALASAKTHVDESTK